MQAAAYANSAARSAAEFLQADQVEHRNQAVIDLDQAGPAQHLQRTIDALTRGAGKVAELFLRNLHMRVGFRIKMRGEQRRERTRDARVRIEQAVVLDHTDELSQALV